MFKSLHLKVTIFLLLVSACKNEVAAPKTQSPRQVFPGLFQAVQNKRIFPDSKTFPDCVPISDPGDIMDAYRDQSEEPDFDLKSFVQAHFTIPKSGQTTYATDTNSGIEDHIKELWTVLERKPDVRSPYSSLIALPRPYIVPGGRFREIYYWDSYFTMLGLAESGREDMIEHMVNNFAWMIRTYGFIPNGNRTYYLTRSQPPFFSLMVRLFMDVKKGKSDSILKANSDALEKEYRFWMNDDNIKKGGTGHVVYLPDGSRLNRYYDRGTWPREESWVEDLNTANQSKRNQKETYHELRTGAESGWDFSSRWLEDGHSLASIQTSSIIPVDLNCLLYHLEIMLAEAYSVRGKQEHQSFILEQAEARKKAMERFCWDRQAGYFKDYNWKTLRQMDNITLAGAFPLYFNMVEPAKANSIAATLQKNFLKPGGLVTTLINTGQQWDAPNGWAPLQWIAIKGLRNYQKHALANEVSRRWTALNLSVYRKTGKLMEKYNVSDTSVTAGGGEYPSQDGFGWTNGVLLKLLHDQGR